MPVALLCLVALAPPADPTAQPVPPPLAPSVAPPVVVPADPAPQDPATAPLPPPTVLKDGVRAWGDLPFRRAGGELLKMDLVLPPAEADADPTPLLVFVHGGGWVAGTKLRYKPQALEAARRGSAAAAIQYRLSRVGPGGTYVAAFPAALEDVRAALAFLVDRAEELNVDPARVALIGDSAGGHLSLLAALSANGDPPDAEGDPGANTNPPATGDTADAPAAAPPRTPVAAVVNLFGVTDMPAYYTGSRHARTVLSLLLAGHLRDRAAAYDAASPVRYVDADDPPVLTLHGTADPVVPFDQAERLHAALREAGTPNELIAVEGGTHGLFRQRASVRDAIVRFLDEQFAPAAGTPGDGPNAAAPDAAAADPGGRGGVAP